MTMVLPSFDLGEAINQAIAATATVLGVLGGGLLAFKLGLRQLRQERAIDRRLDWHEKLLSALDDYRGVLRVLVGQYENPPDEKSDLREYALGEATKRGRDVQTLLRRAELYGDASEQAHSTRLFKTQLDLYIATWSFSANPKEQAHRVPEMKRLLELLDDAQSELVSRIRGELGMAPVAKSAPTSASVTLVGK
jgi:hypothetical protein